MKTDLFLVHHISDGARRRPTPYRTHFSTTSRLTAGASISAQRTPRVRARTVTALTVHPAERRVSPSLRFEEKVRILPVTIISSEEE